MCKINLSTGEVRPTIDLDALLEDAEAPTVHTAPVRTVRYDRMKDAYPERIAFRAMRGTKDMLKKEAERLELSVTQLIKESIKEYLKNH